MVEPLLAKVVKLVFARKRLAQFRLDLFTERWFTFYVPILVSPAVTYFTRRSLEYVERSNLPVEFTFSVINL